MRLPGRATLVGAYVCPRGVFAVQCRSAAGGMEIERTFDVPFSLKTAEEAGDHLVSVLRSAGIAGANVSLAVRGFGVAHQNLHLPAASDDILAPIIEREVRRLEPHLGDCVVQWAALSPVDAPTTAPAQRAILAIAAPRDVIQAFDTRLRDAGHRLQHLTALPTAVQRLLDHFDSGTGAIATIAPLPDGAYIGFSLGGGVRLIVEPPLPQDARHEAAALSEEMDLATMFVRQQFRGVNLDRVVLVGARDSLSELKGTLGERLKIPTKQLEADNLGPVGFVALGAVIDARSESPQSLGGATRARAATGPATHLRLASVAAVFVLALVGLWTVAEVIRSVRAERALASALRQVEQDSFSLAPVRSTAEHRRLLRDATEAVRVMAADRVESQRVLAGIASVVRPPVRLDSLRLVRAEYGWQALVTGDVQSSTNAHAVQALHDLYRELPDRLNVDSVRLRRLTYDDSPGRGEGLVRFQLLVGIRTGLGGAGR